MDDIYAAFDATRLSQDERVNYLNAVCAPTAISHILFYSNSLDFSSVTVQH